MDTRTGQVFEATKEQLGTVRTVLAPDDPGRFVELPSKPYPECNVCKGRGTKKSWGTAWAYGACPKCFPDHPQKARSFSAHLSAPNNKLQPTAAAQGRTSAGSAG